MSDFFMVAVLLGSIGVIGLLIHWCASQVESED